MATTRQGLKDFSFSKVAHDLLRAVADAALLPHQAGLALDAILRVWYRRLISHREIARVDFGPGDAIGATPRGNRSGSSLSMGLGSLFSGIVGWAVLALEAVQPAAWPAPGSYCGSSPRWSAGS